MEENTHRIRAPLVLPRHTARKPPRQQLRHLLAALHRQHQRGVAIGVAGDAVVLVVGVDEELLRAESGVSILDRVVVVV